MVERMGEKQNDISDEKVRLILSSKPNQLLRLESQRVLRQQKIQMQRQLIFDGAKMILKVHPVILPSFFVKARVLRQIFKYLPTYLVLKHTYSLLY